MIFFIFFIMLSTIIRLLFWLPDLVEINVGNKKKYNEFVGLLYQYRTNMLLQKTQNTGNYKKDEKSSY